MYEPAQRYMHSLEDMSAKTNEQDFRYKCELNHYTADVKAFTQNLNKN